MAVDHQTCKLEDLCRLCLEGPGCIDIYQTYPLPQNIYSCTGIKVSITDTLPRTVCKTCFEIVNSANRLRIIATKNDTHLKELMKSTIYMTDLNMHHEKENICQEGIKDSDNSYGNNKSLDNENHNEGSCINAVNNKQSQQPIIIKVRTDLFRNPPNEEQNEENNISKCESMDVVRDIKCDESIELKCDVCSKIFETRKKLYLHKRLHNKTHSCTVKKCVKKFSTKSDLEKHVRTHTGEKPFVCNFCEKRFSQSGTLKIHMESVHGMCKVEVREEYVIE